MYEGYIDMVCKVLGELCTRLLEESKHGDAGERVRRRDR